MSKPVCTQKTWKCFSLHREVRESSMSTMKGGILVEVEVSIPKANKAKNKQPKAKQKKQKIRMTGVPKNTVLKTTIMQDGLEGS